MFGCFQLAVQVAVVTPESFQIQGAMATAHCGGQLLAFPAESANIRRDKMWCRFPSIPTSPRRQTDANPDHSGRNTIKLGASPPWDHCFVVFWDQVDAAVRPPTFKSQYKRTAVLQAVLLDGHLLGQLGQRLVDGVAAPQRLRKAPLEPLHLLQGALGKGRPATTEQRDSPAVARVR